MGLQDEVFVQPQFGLETGQKRLMHAGLRHYNPHTYLSFVLEIGLSESSSKLASDARGWQETKGSTVH